MDVFAKSCDKPRRLQVEDDPDELPNRKYIEDRNIAFNLDSVIEYLDEQVDSEILRVLELFR